MAQKAVGDWLGIAAITAGVYLASGGPLPRRRVNRIKGLSSG